MLNAIDRHRLMQRLNHEPIHPMVVVAKCAAGIAIITGIAIIGVTSPETGQTQRVADQQHHQTTTPAHAEAKAGTPDKPRVP